MRSDLVEQAAAVVQDPPVLINMVSQRVRQLNNGRPPLIRVIERLGQADIALREIIEGKIVLSDGEITEFPGLEEEQPRAALSLIRFQPPRSLAERAFVVS